MEKEEYLGLYRRESSSWYSAKRELILAFLQKYSSPRDKILEVGCGMGGMMKFLKDKGFQIRGVDKYQKAVDFCRKRNLKVDKGLAEKLPYQKDSFDVILAIDLLEHLAKSKQAIAEFSRVLKPNGLLIVTVPAFDFLWSRSDEVVQHTRRYTISLLKMDVGRVFKPLRMSYFFSMIFFPHCFLRLFRRIFKERRGQMFRDEFPSKPKVLERSILCLYRLENIFLKWFNFPFGVGIIGVFRNKKSLK